MANHHLPVVDFQKYGLNIVDPRQVTNADLAAIVSNMKEAFTTTGFLYLKNHGIAESTINYIYKNSANFFNLPDEIKRKYVLKAGEYHGWIPTDAERLNPDKPHDIKETFNYIPLQHLDHTAWPGSEVKGFEESYRKMYSECHELAKRILEIIALGLGKERCFLQRFHHLTGQTGSMTALRSLYYPPLSQDYEFLPGQLRLGEHSDYGSITLLFQDDAGGLEVCTRDGTYVPAKPIPGTIVVNIGDAMQRWTADRLLSNKHRVALPSNTTDRSQSRRSIAFFLMPDDKAIIQCLDGSRKYQAMTMLEYLEKKFQEAHY